MWSWENAVLCMWRTLSHVSGGQCYHKGVTMYQPLMFFLTSPHHRRSALSSADMEAAVGSHWKHFQVSALQAYLTQSQLWPRNLGWSNVKIQDWRFPIKQLCLQRRWGFPYATAWLWQLCDTKLQVRERKALRHLCGQITNTGVNLGLIDPASRKPVLSPPYLALPWPRLSMGRKTCWPRITRKILWL